MQNIPSRLPQERRITTEIPGPKSKELNARREAIITRAMVPGLPAYVAEGDGGVLVDVDGNSFIDFASGIAVTGIGSSNAAVAAAVAEQAAKLTHTCFLASPYEGYVAVAEKVASITPISGDKKVGLFSTGAEANENAVKVARYYTQRPAIIVFDNAFHGRTNLTVTMTAKQKYKDGFGPLAPEVYRVPGSYPLHDGLSGAQAAQRSIDAIAELVDPANVAAVVIEPIPGEGGFIIPAEGFLREVKKWCEDNGSLFILDEIQSGFGRTGAWFACEHEDVEPDIITFAKAVAGGLPLSGLVGKAEIMDSPHVGGLGGTYAGNPIACAASLAALEEIERLDLMTRAEEIGAIIREVLEPLLELDTVADIRGRAAMQAIEFCTPDGAPNGDLVTHLAKVCRTNGLAILTCGEHGNIIRLLPPLVIDEALLREGLEFLADEIWAAS